MHTVNSGRKYFFNQFTITVDAFPNTPQVKFPFLATKVVISNDSDDDSLVYSFLRPNVDGILLCDDGPFSMDNVAENRLWFKKLSPAAADIKIRVWAWRM